MGANSSKVVPSSSKQRHQPQTQERLLGRNKKALHAAAKAGDAAQLEQLLQPLVTAVTAEMAVPGVYPGPAAAVLGTAVGWRDRHGRTPFLETCLHGSWECAELLLEAGSNIVAVDAAGNGCLHLASIKGHGHVVDQVSHPYSAALATAVAFAEWHTLNAGAVAAANAVIAQPASKAAGHHISIACTCILHLMYCNTCAHVLPTPY